MTTRSAAAVLIAGALIFAALAAWTLVARSTIPLRLDGIVTSIEMREEKHPGVDDAWFVTVDGNERHVDVTLATTLDVGDTVEKARWEQEITVNGAARPLGLSNDPEQMLLLAPLSVLLSAAIALPPRRKRSSRGRAA